MKKILFNHQLKIVLIFMIFVVLIVVLYYLNTRHIEHIDTGNIKLNLNESNKMTDLDPNKFDLNKLDLSKIKTDSEKITIFYFPGECPSPIDNIYIHDIKNDYYYLPEKNSVIVIVGDYSWTNGTEAKRPDFDSNLYDLIIDDNIMVNFHRLSLID